MRFRLWATASLAAVAMLGCSDATQPTTMDVPAGVAGAEPIIADSAPAEAPALATTATAFAVSGVTTNSGAVYKVVPAGMAVGAKLYIDRTYTAMSPLPTSLQGLTYIQTANNDKSRRATTLMSFDVNQPAIVYVAHDDKIARPAWLSSNYTNTNLDLVSTDGAKKFSVFSRSVAAGKVSLGDNGDNPAGQSMYVVLVKQSGTTTAPVASVSLTPATTSVAVAGTAQLTATAKDAAGATVSGSSVAWSSSATSVATVNSTGLVKGIAAGTAKVTATTGGKAATATITVTTSGSGTTVHKGYYVAPGGSSGGDGTVARPWDLASALRRSFRGGDTLWLRGGTYRGAFTSTLSGTSTAPVVVRQYPGERATIDGQLVVRGSYSTFWGFELMSSVTAPGNVAGLGVFGPGTRIINLVIHDHGGNGIGTWAEGPNTEIYGNLVYNNGRQRVVPNFAHGIYGQNSTGSKWVRENIVFNQFGYGLHFYAEGGALQGIQLEGNVVFQNGTPATSRGEPNLELGGANPASGARVVGNLIYKSSGEGTNAWVGYNEGTQNQDLVLRDNYIVGGSPALRLRKWSQVTASGNTFVGTAELVNVLGSRSGFSWASNRHYRTPTATAWTVDNAGYTFANWVNRAGIGSSDAASSSPSGTQVFVRPNKYERGRANVTVFNWSGAGSASANLSGILAVGQRYEVRNAQNFFGTPAASGTYGGGSITIPLTAVAPPRPVGGSIATLTSTGTRFHSFVVIPK